VIFKFGTKLRILFEIAGHFSNIFRNFARKYFRMMKRLLLLDAYALIYRAYYAFLKMPRINSKGENTSAIFGFVNTLEDVKARFMPTHIGVVFDPGGPTFRHEAYPEYKAQRESTPEDIRFAVPYVKKVIEAMNIPVVVVPKYEADDVIGTLAVQAEKQGYEVLMMTPDKDYGQLVNENIKILKPGQGSKPAEIWGEREVCAKWGIENASQVLDLLALMGDVSDNVPGCPGVGEKTAVKLLSQFGSIDNMLLHTDEIKGALQQKIIDGREKLEFSKWLVTIAKDAPIEFNEDEYTIKEANITALRGLYEQLEFNSLLKKMGGGTTAPDLFSAVTTGPDLFSSFSTESQESRISRLEGKEIEEYETAIIKAGRFGFVISESSINVAADENKAVIIPDELLKKLFADDKIGKVCYDVKRAISELEKRGMELRGELDDTMLAQYLLQPEVRREQPESAERLLAIMPKLMEEMKQNNVVELYRNVEIPLARVLVRMEHKGVLIDDKTLAQTAIQMNDEMRSIERDIREIAGEIINISSPRQVGELLFDKLHLLEKPKKTKTGQYVTDEETLEQIRSKHEVVGKILEYRGVKKLLSTYIEALPKLINPRTGRVHTSFNQAVTATGRLSSSNPNLQNIPVRGEQGKEIRKAFVPTKGWKFVSADYSQVELRLMAHFSGDAQLTKAFNDELDVHSATASALFGVNVNDVTSDMRRKAKTINFGIIYGMSVFGMSERLSISRGEAKEFIDGYFENFNGVKRYMEDVMAHAREKGYVETLMHRRRYLPDINSKNANVRGFAERNAVNAPIQGTAADIIKIAMVRIDERLQREGLKAEMILQVHDELNFNCPPEEVEQLSNIVREEMEGAYTLNVPLKVDIGVGDNWLEAH